MRKIILTALVLFSAGCGDHNGKGDLPEAEITVGIDPHDIYDGTLLSGIVELSHIVPLETTSGASIGEVGKIQFIDGKIHITDIITKSVFTFDKDGNHINTLSRSGRGAGEYLSMSDAEVDRAGDYVVYDNRSDKLYFYDPYNNFVKSVPSPRNGSGFKLLEGGMIAFNMKNGGASPDKTDDWNFKVVKDGQTIIEALPYNPLMKGRSRSDHGRVWMFCENGGNVYMTNQYDDNIYRIDPRTGEPFCCIRFDLGVTRPAIDDRDPLSHSAMITEGDVPSPPKYICTAGDKFITSYSFNKRPYVAVASREGKLIYNGPRPFDGYGLPVDFFPFLDPDEQYRDNFISVILPENLELYYRLAKEAGADLSTIEELMATTVLNGNPILLFYRFKS